MASLIRRIAASYARRFDIDYQHWPRYVPSLIGDRNTVTGRIDGELSTQLLLTIPGENDEQRLFEDNKWGTGRYDEDGWKELVESIKREGIKERVFVVVDQDGGRIIPTVYEGNHRIRAAYQVGVDEIPVEVRFFGHAECDLDAVPWEYPGDVEDMLRERCGGD